MQCGRMKLASLLSRPELLGFFNTEFKPQPRKARYIKVLSGALELHLKNEPRKWKMGWGGGAFLGAT